MKDTHAPSISVIVPDCRGMDVPGKCLEGFAAQTIPPDQFEVILAGPQLAECRESLRAQFAGRVQLAFLDAADADLSVLRNEAVRQARAPLIALYSSELQPYPHLLRSCLSFHEEDTAVNHACLLVSDVDPGYARLHPTPVPSPAGRQSWQAFLSESFTCKTALFFHGQFHPAYGCMAGREFALRLSRRVDLTLFYEGQITGARAGALSLRAACEGHYLAAYYEYVLACAYPGSVAHVPSKAIDDVTLAALLATIRGMKGTPTEPGSPRQKMLDSLCARVEEHARAEGWAVALTGEPPNPPGSLGPLLK